MFSVPTSAFDRYQGFLGGKGVGKVAIAVVNYLGGEQRRLADPADQIVKWPSCYLVRCVAEYHSYKQACWLDKASFSPHLTSDYSN